METKSAARLAAHGSAAEATTPAPESLKVGSELHIALGNMVRRLRQAHSPGDLTLAEATLLSRLVRGAPATPGALAAEARIRPQGVCTTLAALERRALVTRTGDPDDGRRVLMSATEAGAEIVSARQSAKATVLAGAIDATFTARERKVLADAAPLLQRLAEAL